LQNDVFYSFQIDTGNASISTSSSMVSCSLLVPSILFYDTTSKAANTLGSSHSSSARQTNGGQEQTYSSPIGYF
jgi:hypothetical protein